MELEGAQRLVIDGDVVPCMVAASAFARVVFPVPGTSSNSR